MKPQLKHLSKTAKKFYKDVISEFNLETHHLHLLVQACECLDRIIECRKIVKENGSFFEDRFGQPKTHPALDEERKWKTTYYRLIRELGLDLEPPGEVGRPPRQY
jgi:P27 family predicted phage terminase small subunit